MIDTHCHIHDTEYELDAELVLQDAVSSGVDKVLCVGTDLEFSKSAVEFAEVHGNAWATVGLHPHDAKQAEQMAGIASLASNNEVVAIGECGLDYHYMNSERDDQIEILRQHFIMSVEHELPLIFHIRGKKPDSSDAYDDFIALYDEFKPAAGGVVHSFSAHPTQLDQILECGLYVGVNGIATFTKPGPQLSAYKKIPLDRLVLETDSPLLTPVPLRGTTNQPKNIVIIAEFLAELRDESIELLATKTTENAERLFVI